MCNTLTRINYRTINWPIIFSRNRCFITCLFFKFITVFIYKLFQRKAIFVSLRLRFKAFNCRTKSTPLTWNKKLIGLWVVLVVVVVLVWFEDEVVILSNLHKVKPIGFGRWGVRVAKTPTSHRPPKAEGCNFSRCCCCFLLLPNWSWFGCSVRNTCSIQMKHKYNPNVWIEL